MKPRTLSIFVALSLSLHIFVPPGFMPASVSDGWYLKWCPDGMPAEVMHALFGHAHHHAHDSDASFAQCDLSGLYADIDQQPPGLEGADATPPLANPPTVLSLFTSSANPGYFSRAPPRFTVT
ncbi:MAG: hypothetical protein AAF993_04580 [Pseudomonadota bacterium]